MPLDRVAETGWLVFAGRFLQKSPVIAEYDQKHRPPRVKRGSKLRRFKIVTPGCFNLEPLKGSFAENNHLSHGSSASYRSSPPYVSTVYFVRF